MKMAEVRERSDEELERLASQCRDTLYQLRAQLVTNQLKDSSQFQKTRRDLAKVLTEQRDRERAASA